MEKNDIVEAVCESLGTQGEGIVKYGGYTLFVPYMLPGERAKIRILRVKDRIAYGKIEEMIAPAEERMRPKCDVFYRCGGCQLQHCNYRAQIKFKTGLVRDTLKKIGGIDAKVLSCERSDKAYGYRNKLQLPVSSRNGENAVGFYAERSHRVVATRSCPIHPEWSESLIAALYDFMEKCGLDGYDEETGKGQIRHIVVRELKNRFIVTLVVCEKEIKGIDYFFFLLDKIFPEYSFYLNYNANKTNVVFGEEFKLLRGKGFYECTDGGIVFEAGANTFVQVNEYVRGRLYDTVVSLAEAGDTVIDCYSGGGLLTAMLAKKCKEAIGIEIIPEASACAEKVKLRNGLNGRMRNYCGSVEELLPRILKTETGATVVLDPPRAGVERGVLKLLKEHRVQKIIYVSCNPATLARDLGILTGTLREENGALVKGEPSGEYEITLVQPFDMFPQTKHVETLVMLSKKSTSHIDVEIEFGEGEGQVSLKKIKDRAEARKPKEKVTYKMIQDYIEKIYGFKVHTAYIAEVKRDLGLPMYDAPNAVEELKRPRAHPAPKIVEAIKETFKHFNIK